MTKSKTEMTRSEIKNKEYEESQKRKQKEMEEIQEQLKSALNFDEIQVLSIKEDGENYSLYVTFQSTLDDYVQEDTRFWESSESVVAFADKVKKWIDYIKELRGQYPEFCKQNDFIQSHSKFKKTLDLTHMGYKREYDFCIELADYMKLPNSTSTGFGGGDYEIKRTPKRVKEYNENIDKAINFMIDCITELRSRKFEENPENGGKNDGTINK
jgi:uncharacterized protein (UPF0305 family)